MTVKQLIDKLQRNFAPEQEVFIADKPTVSYMRALRIRSVQEIEVGRAKGGEAFVGTLGPEACVLFTERRGR